jgi:parvulin-like peptidyl-prolyl isomerase
MTPPLPRPRSLALLVALLLAALPACGDPPATDEAADAKAPKKVLEDLPYLRPHEFRTTAMRHLLVSWKGAPEKIRKERTKEEARARAKELSARLRADPSMFDAVARTESDDPTTAPDGGFFGFLSRETGEIPALVEATEALAVGAVSEPVETEFGWHVIQRLAREEGKRVEEKASAVVSGLIVVWTGLERSIPPSQTKEVAYASAAKVVHDARTGRVELSRAKEGTPWSHEFFDVYRTAGKPGFEALGQAAKALAVGEVSDPVETKGGWAVVTRQPYLRCYLRHVVVGHQVSLVQSPPSRSVQEARELALAARDMVRADPASWDEAAKRYSDEPASRNAGGFMGDVTNAGLSQRRVPAELERALHALKPGETSDVVESRLGFHVLWRVD